MEIGEVASETDVIEEAVMDRRDGEEVSVDATTDESLSAESADFWLLPVVLDSMAI